MDLGIITIFFILKLKVIRIYELTSNWLEAFTVLFRGLVTFAQTLNIEQVHNGRRRTVTVKKMKTAVNIFSHNVNMVKLWLNHRQWSKNYEMDVLWQLSIIGTSNYRNDSINRNETWNYLNVTKIYRNDKLNTLKWWYIIIIILYIHVFQINAS